MTIGRRAFLQRLGIGAVAAPAAAKQVMDKAAADLAGVHINGAGAGLASALYGNPASDTGPTGQQYDPRKALRNLLADEAARAEYTSAMYARNRNVSYIDLDLATKRSFSLAAKVAYQRQRNVARQIDEESSDDGPLWQRPENMVRKAARFLFVL
jgi:hypothetical protein